MMSWEVGKKKNDLVLYINYSVKRNCKSLGNVETLFVVLVEENYSSLNIFRHEFVG